MRVSGPAPADAAAVTSRHLRACLAPAAAVAPVALHLRWQRTPRGHQAVVDVTWGAAVLGARLLRARAPGPLLEAAAVATCVALDQALALPGLRRRALRRQGAAAQRRPRRGPVAPPAVVAPDRELVSTTDWRAHVSGVSAFALAPATTGGVSLAVSGGRGRWSLRFGGRALVPGFAPVAAVADGAAATAGVTSSQLSTFVAGCVRVGPIDACPVIALGLRHSAGVGLASDTAVWTVDGDVGARVSGTWSLWRHVGFELWAEALWSLVPTTLRVDGAASWRREGLGALVGLGVVWTPG